MKLFVGISQDRISLRLCEAHLVMSPVCMVYSMRVLSMERVARTLGDDGISIIAGQKCWVNDAPGTLALLVQEVAKRDSYVEIADDERAQFCKV